MMKRSGRLVLLAIACGVVGFVYRQAEHEWAAVQTALPGESLSAYRLVRALRG